MTEAIAIALIAAIGSIITAALALLTRNNVKELHVLINSNLDKQILARVDAAVAKEQLDERDKRNGLEAATSKGRTEGVNQERSRQEQKEKH